ncbi:hypothetical protein K8638_01130 [Myxococcus sp. RHST-1-4]|nr:hypothetical protein [Myxococcus sp. RHSTA-1-4]
MNRFALLLCLLSMTAAAQPAPDAGAPASPTTPPEPGPREEARAEASEDEWGKCPEDFEDFEDEDEHEASVLAPLQLSLDGHPLTPTRMELHGLRQLTDTQVRALIGDSLTGAEGETPLTAERAQTLLRRLARTGLFARVEPRLRVPEQGPVVMEVHLEEHPIVTSVELEGLQDLQASELLEELLRLPHRSSGKDKDDDEDDDDVIATLRIDSRRGTLSVVRHCPPPHPPLEWLARLEDDTFRSGVILGGVARALERTLEDLRGDGYLLASLTATLHPDGRLVVTVDEGRLEAVDVEGVPPEMAARVREALALKPGDVFLRSDARRAVERLESRLPFLVAADVDDEDNGLRRKARIVEVREADGTRNYRTEEAPRKKRRREQVEFELNWRELVEWWESERDGEGFTLEEKRLVVHVRPRRPDLDLDLLPVHTQVTGFAPGVAGHLRIWDPGDRAHLTLDAAFFIPLRLGGQHLPDDPEGTREQRQVNLLGGAKAQVPAARLAEVGVQGHDFTDTLDRWRLSDIDSYIYSALINRPDREYFRRKGFTAFATWRWMEEWLAGVEYRADRYESMRSFTPPLSLFRRDSPPFPNAPVSEGHFRSLVLRLEYASDAPPGANVGSLFRTPETSLFRRNGDWNARASLRGLLTLEVGDGPGASGADTRFWKLVSDLALDVPTGMNSGVRLRVRTAGGEDLPEQKREALGGWSALRGFGFKELRGDVSLLTTAEYRWHVLGIFADVGSVRMDDAWTEARLGVGGSFHFGDDVRFDVAWRTDQEATATPEARLLFVRTF